MATMWYYSSKNQQKGPITWDELRGLAREGQLRNSDMVWQEGTPDWVRAGHVEGLFIGSAARAAVRSDSRGAARESARGAADEGDDPGPRRRRDVDDERRPRRSVRREPEPSSKGLIIGLIAGGGALVIVAIVVVIIMAASGSRRAQKKAPVFVPPIAAPGPRIVGPGGGREILRVDNTLNNLDPQDRMRGGCFCKTFQVKMVAGRTYTIDHMDAAPGGFGLDPYLRLENSKGIQVALDDDGGEVLNARIVYRPPASDTYRIICTTFGPGETGAFTLTVREN